MCVSQKQVTVCDDRPYFGKDIINAGGGLPDVLRLITDVPRGKVRVKRGTCPGWDSRLHQPFPDSGLTSSMSCIQVVKYFQRCWWGFEMIGKFLKKKWRWFTSTRK